MRSDGDLSSYFPDFIVRDTGGKVWIIETKGSEELELPQKWPASASGARMPTDFLFVDQTSFETQQPKTMAELAASFTEYKA